MIDYRKLWKHLVSNKQATAQHVIQFHILRAIEETDGKFEKSQKLITQSLAAAFTPVRRKSKLENGREPLDSMHRAANGVNARGDILGAPFKALDVKYQQVYIDLVDWLKLTNRSVEEFQQRHYVYIFVRQDMFAEYQLVQAAHVAMVAGANLPKSHDPNKLYFTVVGVADIAGLIEAGVTLNKKGYAYNTFFEPDIGNEPTAIASEPIPALDRGELLNYNLLRFSVKDF